MSDATLFGFGAAIFFVVFTGAILYGMALTEEYSKK
jgi:hypothetical protein